jgi:hypothetical protein
MLFDSHWAPPNLFFRQARDAGFDLSHILFKKGPRFFEKGCRNGTLAYRMPLVFRLLTILNAKCGRHSDTALRDTQEVSIRRDSDLKKAG